MTDWTSLLPALAQDAAFAALAGTGFALVSAPATRTLPCIALLAALGHALRLLLLTCWGPHLSLASFGAALLIGLLAVPLAKRLRCPAEVLAFPALLPMIPGMYAYEAVLALIRFMGMEGEPPELQQAAILDFFRNGLTALFVMSALVIGMLIPLQFVRRMHFTRGGSGAKCEKNCK